MYQKHWEKYSLIGINRELPYIWAYVVFFCSMMVNTIDEVSAASRNWQ